MLKGFAVFLIAYFLIAGRRLSWLPIDRPAAAMIGAILCVIFGVLSPDDAAKAVDLNTLILLFGVMGIGSFLAIEGFFNQAGTWLAVKAKTPKRLLGGLVWGAGIFSALITNDAVCVLCAPIVIQWIKKYKLPPLPFLLALCTAANTGSVATLVGNPQNMLVGILGNLSYRNYFIHMLPVSVCCLAINHLILYLVFKKDLEKADLNENKDFLSESKVFSKRTNISLITIILTFIVFLTGAPLSWTAVGGFTFLVIVLREEPHKLWNNIDWSILLFFAALFIVVEGLIKSGAPDWAFNHWKIWNGESGIYEYIRTSIYFLIGSNIVSNVPFILVVNNQMSLFPDQELAWEMLAMASTFAGNLTLIGSVANIIVAEKGREIGGIGFWEYLKVGFPLAIITTLLGTVWLLIIK